MQDLIRVCMYEAVDNLQKHSQKTIEAQWTMIGKFLLQRFSVDIIHYQKRLSSDGGTQIMHRYDVFVGKQARRFCLPLKAGEGIVGRLVRGQLHDRDVFVS